MSAKYFLDTNILVYTFDPRDRRKQRVANHLVATALQTQQGVISFQVVQEFLNVATKKFSRPLSYEDAQAYLASVLTPLCSIHSSTALYENALGLAARWQFSFYDSLIVSAAEQAGCDQLISEDLQHKQQIGNMRIVNPFVG